MRQSHLILSNATIMWVAQVIQLVPQLIIVPYLISNIGEGGYGIYALVWSLMMSIQQLQMSLQSGVVKYSAGFLAQGRMDEINKVVSSSFIYSILLSLVACVCTLVAAAFYNDPSGKIGSSLVVVGIMILFIFPLTPYIAVIQSRQHYYVGAVAETISKYISLLVVVVWYYIAGPSVEALIIIMAGMLFFSRLAQVPIAYNLVPRLQNRLKLFDWGSFQLIGSFGATTVVASLFLAANSTGVRWLMGIIVSTSFVAHLAIMLMPGMLLSQMIGAITITIMPATSGYEAIGNQHILQELLLRGTRYTSILGLAALLTASLLMRNILSIWVGQDYVFLAPYAIVLFASQAFFLSTSVSHHMLKGMDRLWTVVSIYGLGLAIIPIGLILLIFYIWHNPYISVTTGLSVGHLVCGYFQIRFCTKAVHADFYKVCRHAYIQPFLVMLIVSLVSLGIVTTMGIDGLIGCAGVSVIALLVFFGGCYFFIATTAERRQVKSVLQLVQGKIYSNARIARTNLENER